MGPSDGTMPTLVIERANGRMSQPFPNPVALYHLMANLAPVVPMDATWRIEPVE